MSEIRTTRWFDAHLDLAYLALNGRDMLAPLRQVQIEQPGAAVTIPSLRDAAVATVLATIFVQPLNSAAPAENGRWCYRTADEAYACAEAQLNIYDQWLACGALIDARTSAHPRRAPGILLLMEGCACVRTLDDLNHFYQRGVRVISLTWTEANRWAAGNEARGGLTQEGKSLLMRAAELGMVLDTSHLCEESFFDALQSAQMPKIASHSNCRSLLPPARQTPRNLSDRQISELMAAGGVIGINLFSKFLAAGRAAIDDVIGHIEHISDLGGSMDGVGLGSDMDGGFDSHALPRSLESHLELPHLCDALSARGISDADIAKFSHANWERFFTHR